MKSVASSQYLFILLCFIGLPVLAQQEISRDWTSFVQTIQVSTDKEIKFKVVASAKTVADEDWAWSGIWARVDTKNGEDGFFDNMGDRPIISNEWNSYIVSGTINKNAKRISFGGLCIGNGKFFFDDFEVLTEKPDGSFEKLDIKNSSFENEPTAKGIPDWISGIVDIKPVKVKEFAYMSSDDRVDGNLALLIQGEGIEENTSSQIGPIDGYSPQIGTLISMLNNLSERVERTVGTLDQRELDYLLDEKANSIGALIMHLVATEVFYQNHTFGGVKYEDTEAQKWASAMDLGEEGRKTLKGYDAKYYFDVWKKVRAKTLEEFKKRDDNWLAETRPGSNSNNHFAWFHVMEHQSSHLGQMLLLRKRIPEIPKELDIEDKIKD